MATLSMLTNDRFKAEIIDGGRPALIEFGSPWCPQCETVRAMLEILADTRKGAIGFYRCDITRSPDLAARFGIRSVPSLVLMKGGKMVGMLIAPISRDVVEGAVRRLAES